MKILNHNNKEIPVLHFQGNSKYIYHNVITRLREQQIVIPRNLGIITFCDKEKISESPLIYQLVKNSIAYENPAKNIVAWKNTLKLDLTLQAIDKIEADYVFVSDSLDVVLTSAVTEILDRYKSCGKDVLYGATKNNYPDKLIDKVAMRDWFGHFKYLNAGTCIGEKNKVRKFYLSCADLSNKAENPTDSEQFIIRTAFDKCQNWVGFDYNCECFQTFSRVKLSRSIEKDAWIVKKDESL